MGVKRTALLLAVAAAFVAVALVGQWQKQGDEAHAVTCVDPVAGCRVSHPGTPVTVRFSRQPVPLETFHLDVAAPGVTAASAEFQMQGMEMGFNRYDLRRRADGGFAAEVTLPVCVSGRHDWTLFLTLDGRRYAVPFTSYR